MDISQYTFLARLFRYPEADFTETITGAEKILKRYGPAILKILEPFFNHISGNTLAVQQEYYTATFDVQPLSTLDIGYVLFGDDYKRGVFLVNMKREHLKAGNDCGSELPDHLPCILTLLPRMEDHRLAEELACSILIPAVEEMSRRFKNHENHYCTLLVALREIMLADFPATSYEKFQFTIKTPVQ